MARISYLQGSVLQGAYIRSLLLTDRVESQYHVWGGIHDMGLLSSTERDQRVVLSTCKHPWK